MTKTGVVGKSQGGCPGWVKLLLVGSLMLNVLVIGVIAGHQMRDKDDKSGNRQVDWILRLVPEDRRDFTKAHFRDIREPLKSLRTERRQHLTQIVTAIRTEPFTADNLNKILTARRDAGSETRSLVHDRLVVLITEFSPDERAYFAKGLEERIANMQRRRSGN
ncbi:MAG: periplasmic heavy metal sensor [Pseudomonadota bacterium]